MRRNLALVILFAAAPFAATADGPPPDAFPSPLVVACCEAPALWTGVYIGTQIGAARTNPTWSFPFIESFNTVAGQSFSTSAEGTIWGGHLGINYQVHHFVIGAEASYTANRLSGT